MILYTYKMLSLLTLFCLTGFALSKSSDWSVLNGGIMYKNSTFLIKGMNVFGHETCDYVPHGLHVHPMEWYLDFAKSNGFNLIRYPISEDWIIHGWDTYRPSEWAVTADPVAQTMTSLEILDRYVDELAKRGMFILFDMHRLECGAQSHELWYSMGSPEYTEETFFYAWEKVLKRYKDHPAFHAIDLLNEPRGVAEWSLNPDFSWNLFVESAFDKFSKYYDGIIYVEGTGWGRSYKGMHNFPLDVPQHRIVYSPHVYGPSVAPVASMQLTALHADWTDTFGWLVPDLKTVVIGEFGGRFIGADRDWQNMFVDYLIDLHIAGVYWVLNPTSNDSGGLLCSDWSTPEWDKLELLDRLQPNPTDVLKLRRNLRTGDYPSVVIFKNRTLA